MKGRINGKTMAIINKNAKGNKSQSDATDNEKQQERQGKVVDIFQDKQLPTGEKRKIDKDEDAWVYSAPPTAGRYNLKLFPAKEFVILHEAGTRDNGSSYPLYYTVNMECKITDPQYADITVYAKVTTSFGRGKQISTAAGLIIKLGYRPIEEADDKTIAMLVGKAIKGEPTIDVELDWQGWSKLDQRVAYPNMASFPVDDDGTPIHIVNYRTKDGRVEEIRASLKVVHWYGKKDAPAVVKGQGGNGTSPVLLKPAMDEPAVQVAPAANGKAQAATAPAVANVAPVASELEGEEDLLAMLTEDE